MDAADIFPAGDGPLLDLDAIEALRPPRSLSREEGRIAAGPDWLRTSLNPDREIDND